MLYYYDNNFKPKHKDKKAINLDFIGINDMFLFNNEYKDDQYIDEIIQNRRNTRQQIDTAENEIKQLLA